jgi:phosphatidylserine/phosphatidylglycerophosphate/cardiolipin synthase-like enzyme
MADRIVKGQILFAGTNTGIKDLEVHAYDVDPIVSDDHLGKDTTKADGTFEIKFSESAYRVWFTPENPDIRLRIYGRVARLLHESKVREDAAENPLDVGIIEIHKNNVGETTDPNNWLVTNATLNQKTGNVVPITQGNTLTWLVDGANLFPEVTKKLLEASQSISFMNLNYWVAGNNDMLDKNDLFVTKFDPGFDTKNPPLNVPVKGEKAPQIMKDRSKSGVTVRVMVGDIPLTESDTVPLVKKFFTNSPVEVRGLYIGVSLLHAKSVIVDDTAFVVGSGFAQGYFSDQKHAIHDASHRGSLIHDVSVKLTGPGVKFVKEAFATIWNAADPAATPLLFKDPAPPNNGNAVGLQVVRTLPGKMFKTSDSDSPKDLPHGETGILEAYQRAIANAEDYVYIEDQYLTNEDIFRALIHRVKEDTTKKLQLIILVNMTPDIPGYSKKQIALIKQLEEELKGDLFRIGFFTPWSWQKSTDPARAHKPVEIMPIYIHSKTAFIDDRWATTGSANLDGSAMNHIEISTILMAALKSNILGILVLILDAFLALFALTTFLATFLGDIVIKIIFGLLGSGGFSAFLAKKGSDLKKLPGLIKEAMRGMGDPSQHANPQQDDQPPRHAELNIVAFNDIAGQPQTDKIIELRETIWKEFLGIAPGDPLVRPNPGGWLKLWNDQAAAKLEAVKKNEFHAASILAWQPHDTSKKYLSALGIDTTKITIREKADRFNYLKGQFEKNDLT